MSTPDTRLIVSTLTRDGKAIRYCALEKEGRIIEIRPCEDRAVPRIGDTFSARSCDDSAVPHIGDICSARSSDESTALRIGDIYLAQVESMPKNLDAAFVRVKPDIRCFLPLSKADAPVFASGRKGTGPLRPGDQLLVQVTREAAGTKLASVSCRLSLPGEFFVIESGSTGISYSHKLTAAEKDRLDSIIQGILNKKETAAENKTAVNNMTDSHITESTDTDLTESRIAKSTDTDLADSHIEEKDVNDSGITASGQSEHKEYFSHRVIVRTNAAEAEEQMLSNEYKSLSAAFRQITEKGTHAVLYTCLHSGENAFLHMLKSVRTQDIREIVSDDPPVTKEAVKWAEVYASEILPRIRLYSDPLLPLYKLTRLEKVLDEIRQKRVWLDCGGFLVIEKTEAFVSIDVNSGKYDARKKTEDAFREINLSAAREAVRQMRLRNLSGVILIDFINMNEPEHVEELMETLRTLLKEDPLKPQLVDMTPLHIVEITRKKT